MKARQYYRNYIVSTSVSRYNQ